MVFVMVRNINALLIQCTPSDLSDASQTLVKLQRFGIDLEAIVTDKKPDLSAVKAVPDIIILDAIDDDHHEKLVQIAADLRDAKLIENLPVVVIGPIARFADFAVDGHLDHRSPANVLAQKLKHMIRLYSMKVEYAHRFKTISTFGVETNNLASFEQAKATRLLVVGKGERYFELAGLFQGDVQMRAIGTFEEARGELESNPYDCLVIDSVTTTDLTVSALKDFKYNAKFFNLPVVIFQEGLDDALQQEFLHCGGCDLFDLHSAAKEVVTHIKTVVEGEHIRMGLLKAFTSDAFLSIKDKTTGLPSLNFFERHLERLANQSVAWNQPLTFGVFQVHPILTDATDEDDPVVVNLMRQVGQTIHSLMRAEDIATYLGDGRFVIATPNTSGLSISALIGRIGSIIKMTEFYVGSDTSRVDVDSHYFDNTKAKSAPEIMQRLYA